MKTKKQPSKKELQLRVMIDITNLMNSIDVVDEESINDFSFLSILLLQVCKDIDKVPMKDFNEYENIIKKYYN